MAGSIKAEKIAKSFGNRAVLDGIDLDIQSGEIFGLLGPSGAGKTTLIRILTGQLRQDSGTALITGTDTRRLSGNDRRRFGITMDDFGVYERLSCYENLKIFAGIYGAGKREINEVLAKVGLTGAAKTSAGKLSKGMTGRLKLARAFMTDPDILFLDEPTSGLDPVSAAEIHKMILDEKKRGKTVFLTTHTMTEAEKLCGNIALLNEGRIVEYGRPEEICRRYDHQRRLKIHLKDGSDIEIPHTAGSAGTVAELIGSGKAETIHTTEPDLETVFMELTGKELSA
ncbi:MAG TPA: ABC transporter ATP-binding protein [Ruminococcaceae bacterium]|nr:ABC transporter ATP-binding protein [Oscillospiraceae bacterium]